MNTTVVSTFNEVHEVEVYDTHPMHIDATFYPLAPGKLLVLKR
jgi:glycine amidinotransferase